MYAAFFIYDGVDSAGDNNDFTPKIPEKSESNQTDAGIVGKHLTKLS